MSCVPHRVNELYCRLSGGSAQIAKTLELAATSLKTVADASIATWDPDAPFVRSMSCSRCVVPFLRDHFCFDNQFETAELIGRPGSVVNYCDFNHMVLFQVLLMPQVETSTKLFKMMRNMGDSGFSCFS